jgi:hypothetical protein
LQDVRKEQKSKENTPTENNEDSESEKTNTDRSSQKVTKSKKTDRQKVPLPKAHTSVKLLPLKDSNKSASANYMALTHSHDYGDPVKPGMFAYTCRIFL